MDTPKPNKRVSGRKDRHPWEPPTLKAVGTVGEVLRGGGGKQSITGGDPGENRKEKGQAH
jgi:hypothetical protein